MVARRDHRRRVLGSHKMVPWRFWQFCKAIVRQIWLEDGENFTSWILPDPGCLGEPKVGSHSDCMVSWDTVGGIEALGCTQGPPQTGFGVAQDGPVEVLAALQGKFGWKTVKKLQVGFCRTQGALGTPR